jgi:two-component system CheB/CheR fusion protein
MTSNLKILHLEDMENDAALVQRELKNANIKCEVLLVDNKKDFIAEVKNFCPDVILADHTLPFFNSLEALKIIKDSGKKIPFILVTATVSEEYAVSVMKEGADDYILKDRLARLPNAVLNAIEKYRAEAQQQKLSNEVAESQKKYQVIIENSMNAFLLTNSNGDILDSNNAACKMFGYTKEEFKTLNRRDVLEVTDPRFMLALQHRKKTGHMKGEVTGIKHNGERFLLEFTSTAFFDANGEEKISSLLNDITLRKQQEEILLKSNERFTHVTKATFDAIWDWDVQSQQLYLGDGFEELFGYHVQNNLGDFSTWYSHIHPEDKERVIQSRLNKIIHRDESTWKDEYRYIRADDSVAYISDRGVLLRNNNSTYRMIGAMQDVTELKENEIAINELNKALEKRAEELATSNEELERFAYVASHDLQEPLRMVSSFLQLLQKKYESQLDETAQKYIEYAVDGAERMKALILDLLEYSRISSYKEAHAHIDLNELIAKTLHTLKPVTDEAQASIVVPDLPQVYGNKSHLTRLFQNLISNALKYRSVSNPVIEIGYKEKSDAWEFFVKDNGIGIEPKYFEKIFIIFQRLHSRNEYNGTGIGLAICKKVVEMHGGKIWVESSKTGSKFYFTISKSHVPNTAIPENSYREVAQN